jgi:predicted secreted protein
MSGLCPIKRSAFLQTLTGSGLLLPLLPAGVSGANPEKKFRLLDHPRRKRDFGDLRSRKVIFLAHCQVNMNARMHRCANVFPASSGPVVRCCLEHELGIVQMPCPELMVTGLGRDRDEPEQEFLRQALEMPESRRRIRELAAQVVFQMTEYRFQDFSLIGVLGSENSPSCGVTRTADLANRFVPGQGVFIRELRSLMQKQGLDLPFKGVEDEKAEEAAAWIEETLKKQG